MSQDRRKLTPAEEARADPRRGMGATAESPDSSTWSVVLRSPDPEANRQAQGLRGLGLGWLKRGRVTEAIRSFHRAIDADPDYLSAYLDLGRVLFQSRRWRDLAEMCRRGLVRFLDVPELHKLLIAALEESQSWEAAAAFYGLERRDSRGIDIAPDEILCCLVARNEKQRLPFFLKYYRQLGVNRFLVIDNGSNDGSVEFLLDQPDVHIWHSALSFKRANFGSAWFEILLRRYGIDHWCLTVDADELLYFDGAPQRSLHQLCAKLDRRDKRAATGLLLDLYGDGPIRDAQYREGDDPLLLCPFFDRRAFHRRYEMGGQYRNQHIYFGGVRQRVFPAEHDYLLSKCVLLRYASDVVLTSGQHLTNIPAPHIAQEEVTVLHFKFFASFADYAREEAARQVHAMAGEQYKEYHQALTRQADLSLYDPELSVRFRGAAQLRELGILRAEEPLPEPTVPSIPPVLVTASERPFWSVLLTVYDRVDKLERALSGVLAQADASMRVDVVCDFSDPSCQRRIAAEVERIGQGRVGFHALPERLGHPWVFNRAIELSTGRWVHILHDDDWVEPGFYPTLRRHIEANPEIGAAFCQQRIHGGLPIPWSSWVERETPGIVEDWLDRIALECRVQFSAMTVRRDVYETLGGFSPDAASAFDWEMWIRIASRYPVYHVPETLVGIGRDASAESARLARSGEEVRNAFQAIEVAARHLPADRAQRLVEKAREQVGAYALQVAWGYQKLGDVEAVLANLQAAAGPRLSARSVRRILDFLRGEDREYKG